jgi:hypothetical protein
LEEVTSAQWLGVVKSKVCVRLRDKRASALQVLGILISFGDYGCVTVAKASHTNLILK